MMSSRAALSLGRPWSIVLPEADGSIDIEDSALLVGAYELGSGSSTTEEPTTTGEPGGGALEGTIYTSSTFWGYLEMADYLYINADNDIVLYDLKLAYTGIDITTATVEGQVKNAAGNDVGDSFTMEYQEGTDAEYYGAIDSNVTSQLTEDLTYYIDVTITQGLNTDFRRLERVAAYHGTRP